MFSFIVYVSNFSRTSPVNDCPYPLDIVVQNIQHVVSSQIDDSSDDEETAAKEVNYNLKLQGFKVVEKGRNFQRLD